MDKHEWLPLPVLRMNLSFAGCGFLAVYHLGVAKALLMNGHKFLMNVQRFAGASAGALVAALLAVRDLDLQALEECISFSYDLAHITRARPVGVLTPGADLLTPVEQFLNGLMPVNAHELATNRLFVSVTDSETKENQIVSTYRTKQELIQYLLASSYIPLLTGSKQVYVNGRKYYDGGMTDNLPIFAKDRTVRVSPFDGRQDICPRDTRHKRQLYTCFHNQSFRVSFQNVIRGVHTFLPPPHHVLESYHLQGIADAKRFLQEEGFYEHYIAKNGIHLHGNHDQP